VFFCRDIFSTCARIFNFLSKRVILSFSVSDAASGCIWPVCDYVCYGCHSVKLWRTALLMILGLLIIGLGLYRQFHYLFPCVSAADSRQTRLIAAGVKRVCITDWSILTDWLIDKRVPWNPCSFFSAAETESHTVLSSAIYMYSSIGNKAVFSMNWDATSSMTTDSVLN